MRDENMDIRRAGLDIRKDMRRAGRPSGLPLQSEWACM